MGKASQLRKSRRAAAAAAPYRSPAKLPTTPETTDEDADAEELRISPVDLAITLETLEALLSRPALLKTPTHKPTRSLIHKLHAALGGTSSSNNNNTETDADRLITALRTRDHLRARALLAVIKTPKLGSLQRWVRECDAANVAATLDGTDAAARQRYEDQQNETWKTLEAIIRTTMPAPAHRTVPVKNTLTRFPTWQPSEKKDEDRLPMYRMVRECRICSPEERKHFRLSFRVLTAIPGPERKPPNLHPAIIWTSEPNTIPLLTDGPITKHPVPHIPNAVMLANVLSSETCRRIIAAAETLTFTPDQAAAGSATEMASVLAHNFYWMCDDAFSTALFERVKPFLQQSFNAYPVRSINRRFRCYRYVPGAIYRPHVDGAWPPSGISPVDGSYVYDASGGREYSRFTFLVYLNDEFAGGETTFFVPADDGEEGLCARAVRPRQGCVLVFPHGDTAGSLVHEGSGVTDGAKYIIRTDVVYEVPKSGRAAASTKVQHTF